MIGLVPENIVHQHTHVDSISWVLYRLPRRLVEQSLNHDARITSAVLLSHILHALNN